MNATHKNPSLPDDISAWIFVIQYTLVFQEQVKSNDGFY